MKHVCFELPQSSSIVAAKKDELGWYFFCFQGISAVSILYRLYEQ